MAHADAGRGELLVRAEVLRCGLSQQALLRPAAVHEPICQPIPPAEDKPRGGDSRTHAAFARCVLDAKLSGVGAPRSRAGPTRLESFSGILRTSHTAWCSAAPRLRSWSRPGSDSRLPRSFRSFLWSVSIGRNRRKFSVKLRPPLCLKVRLRFGSFAIASCTE